MRIAHFTFQLSPRDKSGHRINHQNINRARTHQCIGDLERLLARIGLGNQEIININAQLFGIGRIQRMLGINNRTGAPGLLRFSNNMQSQCGFTGTFRPVNFCNTPTGQPANAKANIQADRACRYRGNPVMELALAIKLHNRAFTECTFDLPQRGIKGFLFFRIGLLF